MRIDVTGLPAPQGSKRSFGPGRMVESSKKVKPWRQDVKYAALEHLPFEPFAGSVRVHVRFYLPRPKGHYRTGAKAAFLRESAPAYPITYPDLDKLLRSTFDALGEAGVWGGDAQVVAVSAGKYFADYRAPGAIIDVTAAESPGVSLPAVRPEAAS